VTGAPVAGRPLPLPGRAVHHGAINRLRTEGGTVARPLVVAVLAALVAAVLAAAAMLGGGGTPGAALGRAPAALVNEEPVVRDLDPYRGHGAWVDAFDFAPAYQSGGATPAFVPASVDAMAEAGVRTVFVQATRNDSRSPAGLVDRARLAQILVRAHRNDMRVVGWYLPTFADVGADLARLEAIAGFEVLGHRFDGVAVDIEFTEDVPDHAVRNRQLVELSRRFRASSGTDAIGAIVLPPVQLEVVNRDLWPDFPYDRLAEYYDVWLPMSYWTFRREDSGYNDGYAYNEESTRRLRVNLDDPEVAVHGIGGIGDVAETDDLEGFLRSLVDTGSIGGSIYDWTTLTEQGRDVLGSGFETGAGAPLTP